MDYNLSNFYTFHSAFSIKKITSGCTGQASFTCLVYGFEFIILRPILDNWMTVWSPFIIFDTSSVVFISWGQFHQHVYAQLFLHTQMLRRSTSISPTKLCPTLPVRSSRSYTQLLHSMLYTSGVQQKNQSRHKCGERGIIVATFCF